MKKLKLVIADDDNFYVQSLIRYMLVNCSQSFELRSFTSPEYLEEHLNSANEKADIVLIGSNYLKEPASNYKQAVLVILSEDDVYNGNKEFRHIYKYQHVEKIIAEIIAIYSDCGSKCFIPEGKAASQVIALFSAAGGSGKTSIAICSSVFCARRGAKVLYLNLEAVCSTQAFFYGNNTGRTFSDVIYYLKENGSKVAAKIEGAKCVDPDTGIYFYRNCEFICLCVLVCQLFAHTSYELLIYKGMLRSDFSCCMTGSSL